MDPGAAPGSRGADDTRFLAMQAMKMVSFDWNAPPHLPKRASSAPSSSCVLCRSTTRQCGSRCPYDWSDWLGQLEKMRADAAVKKSSQ